MSSPSEAQESDAIKAVPPNDIKPLKGDNIKGIVGQLGMDDIEVRTDASCARGVPEDKGLLQKDSNEDQQRQASAIAPTIQIVRRISGYGGAKNTLVGSTSAFGSGIQRFADPERELQKRTASVRRNVSVAHYPLKYLDGAPSLMYLARPSTLLPQCSSSTIDLSSFAPVPQATTSKWHPFKGKMSLGSPKMNRRDAPSGKPFILDDPKAGSLTEDKDPGKNMSDNLNIKIGSFGNMTKWLPWARLKGARGTKKSEDVEGAKESSREKTPRRFGLKWIQNLFGFNLTTEEDIEEEEPTQPVDTYNTIMDRKM